MQVITYYECTNPDCKAEDRDRGGQPPPPRNLICWKCRDGFGMTPDEAARAGRGMMPVRQETVTP